MMNFLSSIGFIKQGIDNWKENANNEKPIKKRKNSLYKEVEQIL